MAQLVARAVRDCEVVGSIPITLTTLDNPMSQYIFQAITSLAITVFIVFIIVIIIVRIRTSLQNPTTKQNQTNQSLSKYSYCLRSHIMTAYEERVFGVLCGIFDSKCYVIPQVHLSKLLDHKVKGQNWQGAFSHINGKSVDFVLLRKSDLSPICAIEIDDWSHKLDERKARDAEVERIFTSVKLPLVRLKHIEYMTKQEIVDQIANAIKQPNMPR